MSLPEPRAEESEVAVVEAFRRFVELTSTEDAFVDTTAEEFDELVKPFLANPRHLPHVKVILGAARQRESLLTLRPYSRASRRVPVVGGWYRQRLADIFQRRAAKLAESERALVEDVSPAEVRLGVLPVRVVETPADYLAQDLRLVRVDVRLTIRPAGDIVPASVALKLELGSDLPCQIVDWAPRSEVVSEGDVTTEAELTQSRSTSQRVEASVKAPVGGAGAHIAVSDATQVRGAMTVSGKLWRGRVVSDAIDGEAFWRLRRTAADAPVGGLDFSVTVAVATATRAIDARLAAEIEFDDWGQLKAEHAKTATVPAQSA